MNKLPEKAQDQIRTDTPLEPRPGIFYLLPKIHKPGNPGRPIISGIGTLTAGLSGYVDSLLRPYATSTPSYLRDTTDFLRKLQSIGDLPDNTILATMDVEALYTNIPHKDGLQAVKNTIPDNVTANLVAELCDFVLTHNYFTFGDNVYLQIIGTAMGTRMAPQYANIFMADLEQRFLSSRPLKPLLYLRYIDDIFIIWTHGKEALEEFHHDFNNFHPTTNLSLVQSTQEIHFLDTTVLINNGHINTTLYRKPTDRYSYLHASSFHPDHTTRSIVYSQALRYNRICSNPSDRDKHLQDLCQAFLQLQYPPAEVKKQIDRARRVPRSYLLQDRPNKENNRTPLAVTFSPQLKPLQRIIKDLQPILKDDPTLSQVLGDRPVLAYRQPRNLKQILTNNHIPHNRTTNPGTYPCNKARCQLCPHIYSGDTITGPNNISHTIRGSFTCTSTNVIYAIMCQQCPSAMYIGQTGQSLRKRINGHKSDVKNYNIHKPVGEHFNLSGHAITDMKVAILKQKNFKSRLQRETAELEFICKLDTINLGLNRDWEWLSHYASIMTGSSQQQSLYQLLYGERYIFEEVLGLKFRISPDAFFQINTAGAEVLYQIVGKLSRDDKNTVLLDVCCGTGAIGLCLACQAPKVVGVEVVEQAVEDAKWNATFNGVSNCGYHSGKAETVLLQFLMSREDDRLLVAGVNPSRAGLHYRVVQAIQNCEAIRTLIYVSCKPEREAMRNFLEFCCPPDSGKKLVREPSAPLLAVPVDMFPQTMHCELVILFTR
ncbi:unnamed protein product [Caretta caretta]